MLSIARSMAVKSVQLEDNTELKGLLAYQAYQFNEDYGGDEYNPDIYDGLYYAIKANDGEEFNSIRGHTDAVRSLEVVAGQENILYSAGSDGSVIKWKFNNQMVESESIYLGDEIIRDISVSPDGTKMVIANDLYQVKLIHLDSNNDSIIYSHSGQITSVEFIDNQMVMSSSVDNSVFIRNLKTGATETIIEEASIWDAECSPDRKSILFVTNDNKAKIYNIKDKSTIELYKGEKPLYSCAYSNDGNIIAIGDKKGTILIFELENSSHPREINAHRARITDLQFSNNDKILVSISFDGRSRFYFTDNFDKTPIVINDYSSWGLSLAFSNKGDRIYTAYIDSNIKRWGIYSKDMAGILFPKIKRNFSQKEWETYVGKDIPYIETLDDYN
jgi:WD40 repeat protein